MTTIDELPAPIRTFIEATNRGDSEAFIDAFAEDAYLSDWGRVFHGRSGVASWNVTDNIGKQAHFELVRVREIDGAYGVTLAVSGNGYNGTGEMRFTLSEDRIARLEI
jgi:hypothetical protein